ncbi:MAG: molybdate ABC transporter substrate-binding protein [Actinophytocola sp.]|nr:molybdate ABC transporter substrate-binding protein [Actinophytocola sp.]
MALAVAGCAPGSADETLTVYAAASLTESFTTLADQFEADHPGVDVQVNFGGSSRLAQQIAEGAPADVFASADEAAMDVVARAGRLAGKPATFATNRLTIAVEPGNPMRVNGIADLARDALTVVMCAEQVPCGRAARHLIRDAGITVRPASEEPDVKSVLGKVRAGEADAGLVYVTDVLAENGTVDAVKVPEAAAVANRYPIATIADAVEPSLARDFEKFVLGDRGLRVFKAAGFGSEAGAGS